MKLYEESGFNWYWVFDTMTEYWVALEIRTYRISWGALYNSTEVILHDLPEWILLICPNIGGFTQSMYAVYSDSLIANNSYS